jgi:hypothetical protein
MITHLLFVLFSLSALATCFQADFLTTEHFSGIFTATGKNGEVFQGRLVAKKNLFGNPEIEYFSSSQDTARHGSYFYSQNKLLHQYEDSLYCLESHTVPPVHQALQAFSRAVKLDPSEVNPEYAKECSQSPIFKVSFVGETYLVCVVDRVIFIRGSEFSVKIQQAENFVFDVPHLRQHLKACPQTTREAFEFPVAEERDQWWRAAPQAKALAIKDCVFIHGSGQKEDSPPTNSFIDYWGNISQYTPQCRTRKFIHMNTRSLGWEDIGHQKQICTLALSNQARGTTEIRDTIIFTHSMGTLLTAGAFANKICNMSTNSSRWYGVGAPIDGSLLINFLTHICANTTLQKSIGSLLGVCDGDKPGGAYASMLPSNPNLSKVRIAVKKINGMMCGTSSYGLNSRYSLALAFLSEYSGLESPNDGLVWYSACSSHVRGPFSSTPSKFYRTSINHADMTCRNGNGWWGSDRRPCDFFASD